MWTWLRSLLGSQRGSASGAPPKEVRLQPESQVVVEVSEVGIRVIRPNGSVESIKFEDLGAVVVETNDTGPWGTDVWWILVAKDQTHGCIYPGGATGEGDALKALQSLAGFQNEAVIQAMGCCTNARFLCWEAKESAVVRPQSS